MTSKDGWAEYLQANPPALFAFTMDEGEEWETVNTEDPAWEKLSALLARDVESGQAAGILGGFLLFNGQDEEGVFVACWQSGSAAIHGLSEALRTFATV